MNEQTITSNNKPAVAVAVAVKSECCATCKFWLRGVCRRHPPVYSIGAPDCKQRPVTLGTDWCGEWKPKKDATDGK
jgi:hypothetical protein